MIQRLCSLLRMQVPVILSRGLLGGSGSVLPTGDGWQTGAYFQKTSGTGAGFYVNEGSVTTASWRAVEAGTFTVGGTVAINITGTYTTGAIVITNASTHGIRVGAFTSGGAATNAMTLDATTSTAVEIHGGITSDPGSGTMVRPLRSRLILATVGNVEAETYGVQGQLVAKSSNLGHWHGGVLGTIECQTALSVYNPLAGVGALVGRIGGSTITVQSSCYLAGVIALASSVGVSNSGVYAGLYVTKTSGATNFSHGAYIENSDIGVEILACTTDGIRISGDCVNAINITSTGTAFGLLYNVDMTTQIGANVEGIKVILERTADVAIGTSNILGAEFIIKQGSDSYAAGMAPQITGVRIAMGGANTKATVVGLKCETQSNGYVDYLGIFSVNDSCTLASGGAVLYIRSYPTAAKLLKIEQPAATTATDGIVLTDNVGTGTITNLITISARNSTFLFNFDYVGSGCVSSGSDSTNCTHKVAVNVGGGTRYLHLFSD